MDALRRLATAAALVVGLLPHPAAAGELVEAPEPILRVGRQLQLEGDPWRAFGVFSPDAAFGPAAVCGRVATSWADLRAHQLRLLERASQAGVRVLKTIVSQDALGPEGTDYRAVDQLVQLARPRDIRLLLVLESHVNPCSSHDDDVHGPDWYAGGYRHPYDGHPLSLTAHAERLAHRYAGDLTVLGYQLVDGAPARCGAQLMLMHSELARVIKVRAPAQLVATAVDLHPAPTAAEVQAWIGANSTPLIDIVSVSDLAAPDRDMPVHVLAAMAGARILQRPLWVGAGGVPRGSLSPRQRAQMVVDKVASASDIGVSGYLHFAWDSRARGASRFAITADEPLARSLPYLATNLFAAVPGCQDLAACPAAPGWAQEPVLAH